MMNTITRNFGSSNVCRISPGVIGASGLANLQRFASSGFVWCYSQIYIGKDHVEARGLISLTKTELSFPKSAQTIQTMQKNNRLLGILKIESANVHFHANPYISPNAQREHICIFTEVLVLIRSLVTPEKVYFSQTKQEQRKKKENGMCNQDKRCQACSKSAAGNFPLKRPVIFSL